MEICDTAVGFGTEDISVADWVAELSQKPKPIAASPAATTTPTSVRILKASSTVLEMDYSTLALKKGSTPDPLQLLRDQDAAQYLIIILMKTIKNLYSSGAQTPTAIRSRSW